ncbi:MAG: ABC transporter ATP-binding protein [Nitrospirae bacterium]|nr:MAG: ABC transporter ATP-binding protein [Nitrospirota bacterium]
MSPPGLSIEKVKKVFLSVEKKEIVALDEVSLFAPQGRITSIVGPTGSGKTTLLRIVASLERPDSGEVRFSFEGNGPSPSIGYVTQHHNLFPWYTIRKNISLPMTLRGVQDREAEKRTEEICKTLGLEEVSELYPYEVSGGMQQRAAIGRVLASDATLWLMDEPFSSVDEKTRHRLQNLLIELVKDRGITVLFVTHSIDEAVYLSDRIVILSCSPGRVVDNFDITLERPRDRFSRAYSEILERVRINIEEVLRE